MQASVQRRHLAPATLPSWKRHAVVSAVGARPTEWGTSCGPEPEVPCLSMAQLYHHVRLSSREAHSY